MGKSFKNVPNFAHLEKKLPEFLTNHVTMKRIKKVSMGHLHCPDKKKILDADDPILINAAKRKISSSEPPPTQPESVVKVLQNPKLVTDILKKLCLSDLKTCRRVSLTWDDLASHVMQTRRTVQISLVYSETRGVYLQPKSVNEDHQDPLAELRQKNLANLIKCMESSRNHFPCQNFRFVSGDFGSPEVQTFYSLFGPQIRELHLAFHCRHSDSMTIDQFFGQMLQNQAPNIQHLKISFVTQSHKHCHNVNSAKLAMNKTLPNLKTLTVGLWFESRYQIVTAILSAASNLVSFYHEELVHTFLPLVMATGKLGTVQNVSFSLQNFSKNYLDSFSKFAGASPNPPQLCQFEIISAAIVHRDWRTLKMAACVINKILRSSQRTLRTLTIHPLAVISKSYKIIFPTLPNLNLLILRTTNSSALISSTLTQAQRMNPERFKDEVIFDDGFDPKIFPRVTSVIVDLVTDRDCFWEHHFAQEAVNSIIFPEVKYLEIQRPCTIFWIQRLAAMFPNVTDLKLTVQNGSIFPTNELTMDAFWTNLEFLALRDLSISPDVTKL